MSRELVSLGSRLKLAREKRGYSQVALATASGLKQPDISKIEKGLILQTTAIARLSAALRVPAAWLELGEGEEPDWTDAAAPQIPPRDFRDRHEVSESDWADLQAARTVLTPAQWEDIRERAAQAERVLKERYPVLAGSVAPPGRERLMNPDMTRTKPNKQEGDA